MEPYDARFDWDADVGHLFHGRRGGERNPYRRRGSVQIYKKLPDDYVLVGEVKCFDFNGNLKKVIPAYTVGDSRAAEREKREIEKQKREIRKQKKKEKIK